MADAKLYFIDGPVPTKEDVAKAKELGAVFRNAHLVDDTDSIEPNSGVYGHVPELYKKGPAKAEVQAPANESKFTAMSAAELKNYAAQHGIVYPEGVNSKAEMAAHLETM